MVRTTCPKCESEDVDVIAGGDDFNSTTITVSRCQYNELSVESVVYRKSFVLEVEKRSEDFWSDK